MITDIIEKAVIRGETLSEEERIGLLDWFTKNTRENDINIMIEDMLTSRQVVVNLGQISNQIGLQIAGEFRSGNGRVPGDGFTGGRFGYPGFTYGGVDYFLAGVVNDVLQVGLSLVDGKLYAGGGNVVVSSSGIVMANSATSWFNFKDAGGNVGTINIAADPNNDLEIVNLARSPSGKISFFIKDTAGNTRMPLRLLEHETVANALIVHMDVPSAGALFRMTGSVLIWAGKDGVETVFNDDSFDVDHRWEGATDVNLLKLDAGLDAIGIGGVASASYKVSVYGSVNLSAGNDYYVNGSSLSGMFDALSTIYAPYDLTDGWLAASESWTRTGNYTFTVSGDVTAKYRKGAKVRYKDGGAYEYGIIISSSYSAPNTTVTLMTNADYAMAAATITDRYISYAENPGGFPSEFNFTVSWNNLTVGNGTVIAKTTMNDIGTVSGHVQLVWGSTTSISGAVSIAPPVAIPSSYGTSEPVGLSRYKDATGGNAAQGAVNVISGGNITPIVYDASGTYAVAASVTSTVPFTWATSDDMEFNFKYFA